MAGTLDVLTNVAYEGPGAIADRARHAGLHVRTHRLFAGDPVPANDATERLVVMGGPMSVDDDQYPWLESVVELLAAAVAQHTPVLGVCLGAQLLARAAGAHVYRGPAPEIGAGSVRLSSETGEDPVFRTVNGDSLDVFHWHGDTFDLPTGSVLLASSDAYAHQAFRIANAWGLQFHVELRAHDAATVSAHLGSGRTVEPEALAAIEEVGARLIDAFLAFQPRCDQ